MQGTMVMAEGTTIEQLVHQIQNDILSSYRIPDLGRNRFSDVLAQAVKRCCCSSFIALLASDSVPETDNYAFLAYVDMQRSERVNTKGAPRTWR